MNLSLLILSAKTEYTYMLHCYKYIYIRNEATGLRSTNYNDNDLTCQNRQKQQVTKLKRI